MRNQSQIFFGLALLIIGGLFLIDNLFDVDLGQFCWPVALIILGVWLLLRPRFTDPSMTSTDRFLGEIERSGPWTVGNESFSTFIGDMDLDLTKADIPPGESRLRFSGFIGDVDLIVPEEVGITLRSNSFVSDIKFDGDKETSFLTPVDIVTDNYKAADRKLRLETSYFVADITVRRV